MEEQPNNLPKTIDEAVEILIVETLPDYLEKVRTMEEHQLSSFHHGFGTQIRNYFRLWSPKNLLMEDYLNQTGRESAHPDNVSSYIITALWRKLNEQE
jgi:hypothetical protein